MPVMTERRYHRIQQVLRHRQPDLTLLAEDVHKPHNLSAMLRTADAVGVGVVHATHPTGGVATFNATSASAEKWVDLVVHASLEDALTTVRAAGMRVYAAHLADDAVDFRDVDYVGPTCVVFGNERHGVSDAAAAAADARIVIPMLGMVQSLNVSVATAVVMFEAQRQRREAGAYAAPRLTAAERDAAAVRWMHPRAAARLAAAGLPLPTPEVDGALPEHVRAVLARLPGGPFAGESAASDVETDAESGADRDDDVPPAGGSFGPS
jgi:tRNA (guanosine-2'-O-)-methyltransferase